MYTRTATNLISQFAQSFPIVGITGPRQSGKTTLAQICFPQKPYISLEDPDQQYKIKQDPRGFLSQYPDGAIFDEIQRIPELLSYLQGVVDADDTPGRFVITGSQNFALSNQVSQSLAGRIGMATLLPLTLSETNASAAWQDLVFQGSYPRLHKHKINPTIFYPSYVQTYLERDVRQIQSIEDLSSFHRFIKLVAGRTGQLLNQSSLAQAAGVADKTVSRWLSILEASYIIFFLQPYHRNFNKRLVKTPKLYFYDTGLACSLLDISAAEQLLSHYHQGALFENYVVTEIIKERLNYGRWGNLFFWRDRTGNQVDVIAEWGSHIHAIEIKSTQTFNPNLISGINKFEATANIPLKKTLISNINDDAAHQDTQLTPLSGIGSFVQKFL